MIKKILLIFSILIFSFLYSSIWKSNDLFFSTGRAQILMTPSFDEGLLKMTLISVSFRQSVKSDCRSDIKNLLSAE